MKIPVNEPVLSEEAKNYVQEALKSNWLSSAGPFVKRFEDSFGKYLGIKHAITVTNGTAAIHLALLSLGIKKGDEIIVPAFSMGAVWMAVMQTGATPVFVDCDKDTWNIDPSLIEKKISKNTKAIIVVHTYGHPCDMDPILEIAREYSLPVIEDAAEAHGAQYKGKLCGTIGTIGCFSFYANKIITTGEGGMLVTNDDEIAGDARSFKDLCHSKDKRFIHTDIGYNYRMTNIQAAIGLGEMENIEKYINRKIEIAKKYNDGLKNIESLSLPTEKKYAKSVYWMYGVLVNNKSSLAKDEVRQRLAEVGIDTRDFFYPPESHPALKDITGHDKFPVCKNLSETGFYLPSGLGVTNSQIDEVITEIKKLFG